MRFVRTRVSNICKHCKMTIEAGSIAIKESFRDSNMRWQFCFSHEDCYTQSWYKMMKDRKEELYKRETEAKVKRKKGGKPGRPRMFQDPAKAVKYRELKRSCYYYKRTSQEDKVKAVEAELERLVT